MIVISILSCLLSLAMAQKPFATDNPKAINFVFNNLEVNQPLVVPEELSLDVSKLMQAIWNRSKPDQYKYKLELLCFCVRAYRGPWDITVEDNVTIATELITTGLPQDYDTGDFDFSKSIAEQYGTIDKIYDYVITLLENDFASAHVEVDLNNMIIASASIDIDAMIADEEVSFTVSNFSEL